jgi:hypothetical protein
MAKQKYNDHPIDECAKAAEKLIRAGCDVYQKWTCGKCGERVMANLANHWTEQGHHEEKSDGNPCGYITDLRVTGCNYMVHASTPEAQQALFGRGK